MRPDISWESFVINNPDVRGIHYKFEDLCRQLFCYKNLSDNKKNKYLHSDSNNPGLEAEPILDEKNKRWIGFQAKYFDNRVNYSEIKHSAELIVKYYRGKLDHVFLYCNKPLNSKSLDKTKKLLDDAGIELEPITDKILLDLVREYPRLELCYFGEHTISFDWFKKHTEEMFDELGERFNRSFNVDTKLSKELLLFVHEEKERDSFNQKKENALNAIIDCDIKRIEGCPCLTNLKQAALILQNVRPTNNIDEWNQILAGPIKDFLSFFSVEIEKKYSELEKWRSISCDPKYTSFECSQADQMYYETDRTIQTLEFISEQANILLVSDKEKSILQKQVMIISGTAGTGKTQLLSNLTNDLLSKNRVALLLDAGIYYTDDPIQTQIINNLRINCNLEELIDILDVIGDKDGHVVPVLIDAINETWNKKLWKDGLGAIIDKINQTSNVRLILSCRTEYKEALLSDSIIERINHDKILDEECKGFEDNSFLAARKFLDYYRIPFTPLEYFGYEISNPLFLTLYCKTYNGEEVGLPELFERLINHADKEIHKRLEKILRENGITEDISLLKPLVEEIVATMYSDGKRSITRERLRKLAYWDQYRLSSVVIINQLVKENVLQCSIRDGIETYRFTYDRMNDYFFAKQIITTNDNKEEIYKIIKDDLLVIKDGFIHKEWNVDIFINICALYAEKFEEECIDVIDFLKDKEDEISVLYHYINSFQWRKHKFISKDLFRQYIGKDDYYLEATWKTLIVNSVKENNPLNADYLHEILSSYTLVKRDYLWTTYINSFSSEDRVFQLIKMYDKGESLDVNSNKKVELLLTLFGWLLTSSNRRLRDYTSKAMIEILKEHFSLCERILEKFSTIDDPYIIQRLYGIVFGVCCKRGDSNANEFRKLAEYVYNTIFNQKKVYPDILLRDYARLIVELFLFKNKGYNGCIVRKKIKPPYKSDPIPRIDDQHYFDKNPGNGTFYILDSMRLEKMMPYGDFGRYVFQSAISHFDIDFDMIFNYTLFYIFNILGYSEEYFGIYDKHLITYDRSLTIKTERIGKKYQWIAMYNVLARISDHYKMIDRYSSHPQENVCFKGAWEPYVRDFDPTLNSNFMECANLPSLKAFDSFFNDVQNENKKCILNTKDQKMRWLETSGPFHQNIRNVLMLKDKDKNNWVSLNSFLNIDYKKKEKQELCIWAWLYAYFVTKRQKKMFIEYINDKNNSIPEEILSTNQTYTVFNREYPWSPSCEAFKKYAWVDSSLDTGKYIPKIFTPPFFKIVIDKKNVFVPFPENTTPLIKQIIKRPVGKVLHTTSCLLWEESYDATKDNPISCNVPCAELINKLKLKQLDFDGLFFDSNRKIATFNVCDPRKKDCFLIRKDILDDFLNKTGFELVWFVDSCKEIHDLNRNCASSSRWQTVFCYEHNIITGKINRRETYISSL